MHDPHSKTRTIVRFMEYVRDAYPEEVLFTGEQLRQAAWDFVVSIEPEPERREDVFRHIDRVILSIKGVLQVYQKAMHRIPDHFWN